MTTYRIMSAAGIVSAALILALFVIAPRTADAWVEYGAYYYTPAPHSQAYYQPMYAYSYAPAQSSQNTYISYPQQNNSYGYGAPSYSYGGYYPQQPSYYPQYQYPNNSYVPHGSYPNTHGQPVPYSYGYPTGETVPWIGGQLCEFPDYDGRALCGSNPNQWIYDPWTGSWY